MKLNLMNITTWLIFLLFGISALKAGDAGKREAIIGDALLNQGGYELLETITTRYGGRMTGTSGNKGSMNYIEQQLQAQGIKTRRDTYTVPGWRRGGDTVTLISEPKRQLRAAAIGYTDQHKAIEADLVFLKDAEIDSLNPDECKGKIGLVAPNVRISHQNYKRLADEFGVRGILLINRRNGGQLLARTANYSGSVAPFPIYSITVEEGRWMQRRLENNLAVKVRIETNSEVQEIKVDNLAAILPGTSGEKVIIGAHFDSWDLGQGAMDNGLGVAQIYEVARLLKKHSPENAHTIEIVWFNAEEWGIWGSQKYVEQHDLSDIRCMLNLDMVGRPIGLNANGFDELLPMLERFSKSLGSWNFERKVANKTWLGSDHHPFIIKGVPSITIDGPIAPDDVRYYHDFADTFDKIDAEMLGRACAIITLLAYEMANDTSSKLYHYAEDETIKIFQDAGLEDRMRKSGMWPFGETDSK